MTGFVGLELAGAEKRTKTAKVRSVARNCLFMLVEVVSFGQVGFWGIELKRVFSYRFETDIRICCDIRCF